VDARGDKKEERVWQFRVHSKFRYRKSVRVWSPFIPLSTARFSIKKECFASPRFRLIPLSFITATSRLRPFIWAEQLLKQETTRNNENDLDENAPTTFILTAFSGSFLPPSSWFEESHFETYLIHDLNPAPSSHPSHLSQFLPNSCSFMQAKNHSRTSWMEANREE
jgi:hypothetical protein